MSSRQYAYLIVPFLLVAIVLPAMLDLGYWLTDAEVLLMALLFFVIGLVLSSVLKEFDRVRGALIAFLIYWIMDGYFLGAPWVALVVGVALYFLLQSRFSENLLPMILTFCVVWILFSMVQPNKLLLAPVLNDSDVIAKVERNHLPPIIHVILDEQMSPDAVSGSAELIPEIKRIEQEYIKRNFNFYTDVRSSSHETQESISDILSLKDKAVNNVTNADKFSYAVKDNRYYEQLAKAGYDVLTIQSSFLDICGDFKRCHTYDFYNTSHYAQQTIENDLNLRMRLAFLQVHFYFYTKNSKKAKGISNVFLYRKAMITLGVHAENKRSRYASTLAMISVLDEMNKAVQSAENGKAYIFHLLLPHTPYMLDEACHVRAYRDWVLPNRWSSKKLDRSEIYRAYWEQSICAHAKVMALVDSAIAKFGQDGFIFIVHGDHGARVTFKDTSGVEKDDSADMTQTYFSVKFPQSIGEKFEKESSLPELFVEHVNQLLN